MLTFLSTILRFFRRADPIKFEAALTIVDALTGSAYVPGVHVKHAQVIDKTGDLRVYTKDGREFVLSIERVHRPSTERVSR